MGRQPIQDRLSCLIVSLVWLVSIAKLFPSRSEFGIATSSHVRLPLVDGVAASAGTATGHCFVAAQVLVTELQAQ